MFALEKNNNLWQNQIIMVQYFTKEGLQKLKDELHYLKTTKNKEIVKLIAEAAAFGDLKENASYHDARDKMAFLRMRIAELEGAINEAIVKEKTESSAAQIGSEVKILFGGNCETYIITAPAEADVLKNKISYQSPLGKKLIGQEAGKEFDFEINGKKNKIKILEVN